MAGGMNIVFQLSPAVDLSPMFPHPVPLETFPFDGQSFLDHSLDAWQQEFPDAEFYVIDTGDPPVFYRLGKDFNTLSLPGADTVAILFLFSAFLQSAPGEALTLFLPASLYWEDITRVADAVRTLTAGDMLSGTLVRLAGVQPDPYDPIAEYGHLLLEAGPCKLYEPGKILSYFQYREQIEKNPSLSCISLLPSYLSDTRQFSAWVESWDPVISELYYLVSDAFQSGSASASLFREVILRLEEYHLDSLLQSQPEFMILPLSIPYTAFHNLPEFLEMLPRDDAGNFSLGPVSLSDCSSCIALNTTEQPLRLEKLSHTLVLQTSQTTRILKIQ